MVPTATLLPFLLSRSVGLNFQIEHHLFPTMPWHNLPKVAPLVRFLCAKHGTEYLEKLLLRALQDIIGSLRKSG